MSGDVTRSFWDASEQANGAELALELAESVLAAGEPPGPVLRRIALLHIRANRLAQAEAALRRALELAPDDVETLMMAARLRHYARDYDGALETYLQALAQDGEDHRIMQAIATLYYSQGRTEMGREWADAAREKRNGDDYGPLIMSDQTSDLSDAEYARALACLDQVERMIASRAERGLDHVGNPSGQWRHDGEFGCSLYRQLKSRDRDVIRKLRLYTEEFSGYRITTMQAAGARPIINRKMPDNIDTFLELLSPLPPRRHLDYVTKLPDRLRLTHPRKFGEVGWDWEGGIINADCYFTSAYLVEMEATGVLGRLQQLARTRTAAIMEIGGGYGSLAHYLFRLAPNTRYVIVDIPESLAFSSIYLSILHPDVPVEFLDAGERSSQMGTPGFTFVSSSADPAQALGERGIDLAINTLSLAEMSDAQKDHYGRSAAAVLTDDGVFFEQNHSVLEEFDYVGSFIAPYFHGHSRISHGDLFHIQAGQGNLWSRPARR